MVGGEGGEELRVTEIREQALGRREQALHLEQGGHRGLGVLARQLLHRRAEDDLLERWRLPADALDVEAEQPATDGLPFEPLALLLQVGVDAVDGFLVGQQQADEVHVVGLAAAEAAVHPGEDAAPVFEALGHVVERVIEVARDRRRHLVVGERLVQRRRVGVGVDLVDEVPRFDRRGQIEIEAEGGLGHGVDFFARGALGALGAVGCFAALGSLACLGALVLVAVLGRR